MLGRRVAEVLADEPPEHPWGDVRDRLRAADATLVNLECCLAEAGTPAGKRFTFRCPPGDGVPAVEAAGVDGVTLANNHVRDFGEGALLETLDVLEEAGVAHAGAGRDEAGAWAPAAVEAGDLEVGLLGITDNVAAWAAGPREPGTAYVPVDPEADAYGDLRDRVRDLAAGCDVAVVGAHWGPNMRRHPPDDFQAFARGLLEAGADLFWGHSAHIFQGVERREEGVILYDTGDLVDDYRVDPAKRNDLSFVFEAQLEGDGVGDLRLVPTRIDPRTCQVNEAVGEDAAWSLERMEALCAGFDTATEREDGQLRVPA